MTIPEAAEYFGISKEAIHNRIRRGSLGVTIVEGVKFVEIDENTQKSNSTKPQPRKSTIQNVDERYYKLLEEQNAQLQAKVEKLENETQNLRDQKEQMLIEERARIEKIYQEKDEQLKNIFGTISSQFMLKTPDIQTVVPQRVEPESEVLEAEIEVDDKKATSANVISLKKYFKTNKISDKKSEKIVAKFSKIAKKDKRIITIGKKFYINLDKYDYKDLLPTKKKK